MTISAYRSEIIYSKANPAEVNIENSYQHYADGVMLVEDGIIKEIGSATEILERLPADIEVTNYPNSLITSGFVDTHIHMPQTGMIASYGEQLLDWLNDYTFPAELAFADAEHAKSVVKIFLDELVRNGTTTALVFGTVHPESVEAFFSDAEQRNLRMIAGKVLMDRHAPEDLLDTPEQGYNESKQLIEKWHEKGRLHYAVTPRFAPTSTDEQLALAGKLLGEYPNLYMHTHLSENKNEIAWVKDLFPDRKDYLDVYEHFKLVGERSVFAHGIHLCDDECKRLAAADSAVSFCPTSNLFLGSGLFNMSKLEEHKVNVGLGTDVGGGTSFSMLTTQGEAYKVLQLQQNQISPFKSLYLATLGGAKSLKLEDKIGTLEVGTEADFIVIDYDATPIMSYRMQQTKNIEERLFVLMTIGDDRAIKNTFAMGNEVYSRD